MQGVGAGMSMLKFAWINLHLRLKKQLHQNQATILDIDNRKK